MELLAIAGIAFLVFIVVAPIVALARVAALSRRLDELSSEIRQLRRAISGTSAPTTVQEEPEPDLQRPQPEPEPERAPPPHVSEHLERIQAFRIPVSPPVPPPQASPTSTPAAPSRTREEWELLIGGNWLNRIGAIVIMLFAGFLLKYAFDRDWITPWLRVALGLLCGAGLAALGVRSHRRGAVVFAQGIIGAGIAVLYLTAYASCNLYHLLPQPAALVLMSAVTAAAVSLAVRCDAISISLLGLAGGFLTPLLLSDGSKGGASGIGLFSYIVLLDIGLLLKDSWAVLEPLALAGTWATYLVWRTEYYVPADISFTIPFLAIFWALFYAMDVYRAVKSIDTYADLRSLAATLNSLFFYIALYYDLNRQLHQWTALATLILASAYLVTLLVVMRRRVTNPTVVPRYVLTTIALLAVATKIQYHGFALSILWALESLAAVWCGLHYRIRVASGAALGLMGLALCALFASENAFAYEHIRAFDPILNTRFLAYAMVSAAIACSAVLFARSREESDRRVAQVLHVAWVSLGFGLLSIETNDIFRRIQALRQNGDMGVSYDQARYLTMGAVWLVYSLPLVAIGLWRRVEALLQLGLAALALGLVMVAVWSFQFRPIMNFTPITNVRLGFLLFAAAVLVLQRVLLARRAADDPSIHALVRLIDAAVALLGFELITVEIADFAYLREIRSGASAIWFGMSVESARNVLWAAVWALYSIPLVGIAVRKRHIPVACVGAGAAVIAVLTIAIAGAGYVPLRDFTTLLNIRAGAFVITALALLAHRRQVQSLAQGNEAVVVPTATALRIVSSLLIFELLTAETWDTFTKAIASGAAHGAHLASLRQLALSVVWLIYSFILLSYGIWRRMVALRYVAIGIYGVTILKVFLSDLSFLDTLSRIFSFLALGFILLLTSYLYQRYKSAILAEPDSPG